jgi:hypothetical protein
VYAIRNVPFDQRFIRLAHSFGGNVAALARLQFKQSFSVATCLYGFYIQLYGQHMDDLKGYSKQKYECLGAVAKLRDAWRQIRQSNFNWWRNQHVALFESVILLS